MQEGPLDREELALGRDLFQRLKLANDDGIERTGSIDVPALVKVLEPDLADPLRRRLVLPALAKFLGYALDGTVINIETLIPPL